MIDEQMTTIIGHNAVFNRIINRARQDEIEQSKKVAHVMNALKPEECECCGKTGEPLELKYTRTWKERKKTGEPLCECFGNRKGCAFSLVIFPDSEKLTRDKGNLHDREGDYAPPHCRGCNTTYGKIHHVNCGDEKCPKCGQQILTCSCNGKYGHVFLDGKASKNYEHLNFYQQLVLGRSK